MVVQQWSGNGGGTVDDGDSGGENKVATME